MYKTPHEQYVDSCDKVLKEAYDEINALGGGFDKNHAWEVKFDEQLGKVLDEIEWLGQALHAPYKAIAE